MIKTRDLFITAYLELFENQKVCGTIREGRRVYYQFDISQEDFDKVKLKFKNTDFSAIKWKIEQLKDLGG